MPLKAIGGAAASFVGDLIGGHQQRQHDKGQANQNAELQREFAQHGIRWKVEDAKRAGIHPLAALGAQTHSAAPVHMGSDVGSSFSNLGQNINRAINATRTAEERQAAALQLQGAQADLDGKILDNQIRASELRRMNAPVGPPLPSAADSLVRGQGDGVLVKPSEITAASTLDRAAQAGAVSDYGFSYNSLGGLSVVPSTDVKERIEDSAFMEIPWAIRNNFLPNYGFSHKGVPSDYKWNVLLQQYDKRNWPSNFFEFHPMALAYKGGKSLYKKWKGGR